MIISFATIESVVTIAAIKDVVRRAGYRYVIVMITTDEVFDVVILVTLRMPASAAANTANCPTGNGCGSNLYRHAGG